MKKKIILGLSGLAVLLYSLCLYAGRTTLVIPLSSYEARERPGMRKGQIVHPFERLNFGKGTWVAYLVIAPEDYGKLNPAFKKISCYKSDDAELFNRIKKRWNFIYTAGDVATVSSAIYFVRDGKIEFESGIVIDRDREGLQGEEYGWLEPVDGHVLSDDLKHFKRVYRPVLFF